MSFPRKSTLNNGNRIEPRVGRKEQNKLTRGANLIGEENLISLIEGHLQTALHEEDKKLRSSAREFLIDRFVPKKPYQTYVDKTDMLPMTSVENIKHNSDLVLNKVCNSSMPLEVAERLSALIEQARKNWESTEMKRMLDETNQRITRMEEEKGIDH